MCGTRIRVIAAAVRVIAVAIGVIVIAVRVIAGSGPGNEPLPGLKASMSESSFPVVCVCGRVSVCVWLGGCGCVLLD